MPEPWAYAAAIDVRYLTTGEYEQLAAAVDADDLIGGEPALIVVDGPATTRAPGVLPVIVAWIGDRLGAAGPQVADLVVGSDDVAGLVTTVGRAPLAATTLALLLRTIEPLDVAAGLIAESAAYSLLQGGPEFADWRSAHPPKPLHDDSQPVLTERIDDRLTITLNRPTRHNAISTPLRDELAEALKLADVDRSISSVTLRGAGVSFCSGGDLDEFGLRPDPVTAHRTRLARSPAWLLHRLRDRTTVELHGAALGGGIEMAAFADRVVAHPDTRIGLPEVGVGLLPGAGGTVSVSRRAGRQRTAALALVGREIDATTALAWGLIDEIAPG